MAPTQTQQTHHVPRACHLLQAWQGKTVWRMLDTSFGDGHAFLATWQAWADDPQAPSLLHYVAISPNAPERAELLLGLAAFPALGSHAADLGRSWFGLLSGFNRIVLQRGQVLLTLCVGPLQAMLREQQFLADSVIVSASCGALPDLGWDRWGVKTLARLCKRGTSVAGQAATTQLRVELVQAGFVFKQCAQSVACAHAGGDAPAELLGHYQPRWEPGRSRHAWRVAPQAASACVVVGAGLSGATVAAALARRGWQVTVLDAAAEPASGASGLPAGLLAPQVSGDDNTRSRLSRAGIRLTLQLCRELLQEGQDWAWSGVLELVRDDAARLPTRWPEQGRQWSEGRPATAAQIGWSYDPALHARAIWHAGAGWVKPARLVQACLSQTGVRFVGQSKVHRISSEADLWVVRNSTGHVLARAPQLVLASASGSAALLATASEANPRSEKRVNRLTPMPTIDGQISWGLQQPSDADGLPPFPVNGMGSVVAQVPVDGALGWFVGATYEVHEAQGQLAGAEALGHTANFDRLSALLPSAAGVLAQRFATGKLKAWRGTRCTTIDRLPAVGPLDRGPEMSLWISTGMGSRGLTYAALCAEMLAARLGAEPLPIEARLAKSINATRPGLLDHL